MALPTTGPISIGDVAAELGMSPTGLSLNHPAVRALAGKPDGPISLSDLRGKSAEATVWNINPGADPSDSSIIGASRPQPPGREQFGQIITITGYADVRVFTTRVVNQHIVYDFVYGGDAVSSGIFHGKQMRFARRDGTGPISEVILFRFGQGDRSDPVYDPVSDESIYSYFRLNPGGSEESKYRFMASDVSDDRWHGLYIEDEP